MLTQLVYLKKLQTRKQKHTPLRQPLIDHLAQATKKPRPNDGNVVLVSVSLLSQLVAHHRHLLRLAGMPVRLTVDLKRPSQEA
jgi:hypothetical protein